MPVFLVTSFPDRLPANSWPGNLFRGSLARGHRVIAPSSYVSHAMIERYKIPPERITVIPRSVDTATFSPAAVSADRIAALRRTWGVLPQTRIVLVPGRIAPRNGQMTVIDAARLLVAAVIATSHSCSPATIAASSVMCARYVAARGCTASTRSAAGSDITRICWPRSPPPMWWWCRHWSRR